MPLSSAEYADICATHHGDVLSYVRRRAHATQIDDITLEAFRAAWQRRPDVPTYPLAWLLSSARAVMLSRAWETRGSSGLVVHIRQWGESQPRDGGDARIGEPEGTVHAWQSLGEADQEVLSLHVWEGLSNAEAACLLGCNPTVYGVRLRRAKWRLAGHLRTYARPGVLPSPRPERSHRPALALVPEVPVKQDPSRLLAALDAAPRREPTPGQRARLRELLDEIGPDATAPEGVPSPQPRNPSARRS
jgi:RNA polymerase sigma-70 factor (ECF subfamily)